MSFTRRIFLQRIARFGGYAAAFSAMNALGLMPSTGPSALPELPSDFGRGKTVAILGAGIAGLVAAYELSKAGFRCTVLEARNRPGGRNFTVRKGTKVEFIDGSLQECNWVEPGYQNAGPARIPSTHIHLLNYCRQFGIPLEVEVNVSRSAMMQSPAINSGKPVVQRRIIHDTRGYIAELLTKAINKHTLDDQLSAGDTKLLLDFLHGFGDLDHESRYTGTTRAGYAISPGAGPASAVNHPPFKLHDLLAADFSEAEFYEEDVDWQATMLQPVGGMDQIPEAFARSLPPNTLHYNAIVTEITTGETRATIAYTQQGNQYTLTADFCICTMPPAVLAATANNFSPDTKQAFESLKMVSFYKVAWESPRFWETESNIYGGISFVKGPVDLLWYPSAHLFSPTGVLCAGYGLERKDLGPGSPMEGTSSGEPTPFGALPSIQAKLDASRNAVEAVHLGRSHLLAKPIYVSWLQIPYSLGAAANTDSPSGKIAYIQLDKPEGRTRFAGDYLTHVIGWQEGALLSAHRAVGHIAAQMKV